MKFKESLDNHKRNNYRKKEILDETEKNNGILLNRIISIERRENVLKLGELNYDVKSPKMKQRINQFRIVEGQKIKQENKKFGDRILSKPPSMSLVKLENDFNNHIHYRQLNKKFSLPHIETIGNKLINKNTPTVNMKMFPKSPSVLSIMRSDYSTSRNSRNITFVSN